MYALRKSCNIRDDVPAISVAIQFAIDDRGRDARTTPPAQKKCGNGQQQPKPTVSRDRLQVIRIPDREPDRAVTSSGCQPTGESQLILANPGHHRAELAAHLLDLVALLLLAHALEVLLAGAVLGDPLARELA